MNEALLEWKSFGPAFTRGWNGFFHSTFDGRVLRILRIFYASLLLVNILTWYPYLELWFGETGIMPLAVSREVISKDAGTVFSYLPTSSSVLYGCYFCFLTQAVLLLFGIFPRFQAVGSFFWLVSFQHRNIMICDGEDVVMRLVGFFVMLMPLHQLGANRSSASTLPTSIPSTTTLVAACELQPGRVRSWALRLLQIQMCIIYLDTAAAKFHGDVWLDGTALYYVSRLDAWFRADAVPHFLFDTPWIVWLMTWSVIVIEFAVPVLIWFRETRRWALVLVAVFHLSCFWMMDLFLFHWIMLCGWCACLTSAELDLVHGWLRKAGTRIRSPFVRNAAAT